MAKKTITAKKLSDKLNVHHLALMGIIKNISKHSDYFNPELVYYAKQKKRRITYRLNKKEAKDVKLFVKAKILYDEQELNRKVIEQFLDSKVSRQ